MNIAENTLLGYIAKYYVKNLEDVKEMYIQLGDLGAVAAQ